MMAAVSFMLIHGSIIQQIDVIHAMAVAITTGSLAASVGRYLVDSLLCGVIAAILLGAMVVVPPDVVDAMKPTPAVTLAMLVVLGAREKRSTFLPLKFRTQADR